MNDLNKYTYDVILAKLREGGYEGLYGSPVKWLETQLSYRVFQPKVYRIGPLEITDDQVALSFRWVRG